MAVFDWFCCGIKIILLQNISGVPSAAPCQIIRLVTMLAPPMEGTRVV